MSRARPTTKTAAEIATLAEGGRRLSAILTQVATAVSPGVTTGSLDALARRLIALGGDEPAFLNYRSDDSRAAFPAALCVSVNEEVVHGLPGRRVLKGGDLVSLDLGLCHQGLYTDMALTIPLGEPGREARRLLRATREALAAGLRAARGGATTGHIGAAVEAVARRAGFGLVRDLGGHGVGYAVHELPEVPNWGRAGEGTRLTPGLVIAVEPMLVAGGEAVDWASDGFTIHTRDGRLAAHFEQTIAITAGAPQILTPACDLAKIA